MTFLLYILLVSAVIICALMVYDPTSLSELGEARDNGMGYLASAFFSILLVVIIESIGAVLYLLRINDDWAGEIYKKLDEKRKS